MTKGMEARLATLALGFVLFLFVALVVYFVFFNRPPEPPRRSLPVIAVSGDVHAPETCWPGLRS
ncbi:MAG: hypothetical protein GX364_03550 [Firmicutes bacterium]|nr:hypothetical protein [Bacillota bacterium]